ncbi:hypothetical protein PR048_027791 [Dryococelus australis]|uniref:TNFR-Cys domain-containing protein n=1 Tax=Dryococelus australis TaxID=614101 RepID=A0ABQ9GHI3_9NEOP|nr:hypothetical protein PR048_027791 [Dryococelus australis]
MSSALVPLLLSLALCPRTATPLQCRPAEQFWDSGRQRCRACTSCVPPAVVLRPCGVHRDALCGPIANLNIDWSWINGPRRRGGADLEISLLDDVAEGPSPPTTTTTTTTTTQGPDPAASSLGRKHAKKSASAGKRKKRKHKPSTPGGAAKERKHHAYRRQHKKHRHDRRTAAPEASSDVTTTGRPEAASQVRAQPVAAPQPPARGPEESFSAAESLVWDGQAFALALAVFACLFFFLVAAVYSIYQARHWRRLKTNFEAGQPLHTLCMSSLTCLPKRFTQLKT